MVRIECTSCPQVILVSNDTVPDGIRPGEWFEYKCPACDEGHYMELAERDDRKKGK